MWTFQEMLLALQDPISLIRAWEEDPLLVKRVSNDLVVVNASKRLFTPATLVQALAKGVVYHKTTKEILSVPFPKMWNLEENEAFHKAILKNDSTYQILSKEDGTLIQSFWYDGRIQLTTRGSMPGTHDEESDHLILAYKLWESENPLFGAHPKDMTLIWELVGPSNPIIQPYEKDKFVLIGAYDHQLRKHLDHNGLLGFTDSVAQNLTEQLSVANFPQHLEGVEGWVVSILEDGFIQHSFKVKTEWWRQQMRSKCCVTAAEVMRRFVADESINTFNDLWTQIMSENGQEELKDSWEAVWEMSLPLIEEIQSLYEKIPLKLQEFAAKASDPKDPKEIALQVKALGLPVGLYMSIWRGTPSRSAMLRYIKKV